MSEPTTLDDLFAKDPTTLTDQEKEAMWVQLRAAREKWFLEESTSKRTGKRAKPSKAIPKEKLKDIKIDDLDLGGLND